jgi:hypothetical protein
VRRRCRLAPPSGARRRGPGGYRARRALAGARDRGLAAWRLQPQLRVLLDGPDLRLVNRSTCARRTCRGDRLLANQRARVQEVQGSSVLPERRET